MPSNKDHLRSWIGRTQTESELVSPRLAQQLAATLDYERAPKAGETLPPLWHWALFPHIATQSHISADGHPQRGGFLPPIPLPRRMWAGSRVRFERLPVVGSQVTRTSQIIDIASKEGRSGKLVFVRIRHELEDYEGPLISEEQDVVYREAARAFHARDKPAAPVETTWSRTIVPDPVLLFRYSADTFNGHRIHYDRAYAPAGRLSRTRCTRPAHRNSPGRSRDAQRTGRGRRVVLVQGGESSIRQRPFQVCAARLPDTDEVRLWAVNEAGVLCVEATAKLRASVIAL
ncbi:3-methylfumaryl-CoA hydratase [Burkholderia sp. YR290]|nr:3-methylfumaryl-CoA hydratase [Burkholderia sp. YR290]